MTLLSKIRLCSVSFSGRMSVPEYQAAEKVLASILVLCTLFGLSVFYSFGWRAGVAVGGTCALLLSPFAFSMQVRRLHDVGVSGWWVAAPSAFVLSAFLVPLALFRIPFLRDDQSGWFSVDATLLGMTALIVPIFLGTVLADVAFFGWLHSDGDRRTNRFGAPTAHDASLRSGMPDAPTH